MKPFYKWLFCCTLWPQSHSTGGHEHCVLDILLVMCPFEKWHTTPVLSQNTKNKTSLKWKQDWDCIVCHNKKHSNLMIFLLSGIEIIMKILTSDLKRLCSLPMYGPILFSWFILYCLSPSLKAWLPYCFPNNNKLNQMFVNTTWGFTWPPFIYLICRNLMITYMRFFDYLFWLKNRSVSCLWCNKNMYFQKSVRLNWFQ